MKTLHVTPQEYDEMRRLDLLDAFDTGSQSRLVDYCVRVLGCELYGVYNVSIRKDVPHIPFFSKGVERMGGVDETIHLR